MSVFVSCSEDQVCDVGIGCHADEGRGRGKGDGRGPTGSGLNAIHNFAFSFRL